MARRGHRLREWLFTAFTFVLASGAGAQTLGTFRWQLQPYCNVITVTVSQLGSTYRLDGTDNMCGAASSAAANGTAFVNPSGTIGFGLTIVPAGPSPLHLSAAIDMASLSGTWTDTNGNGGTFAFNPAAPAGAPRPAIKAMRFAVGHQEWDAFTTTDNLTFTRFTNRLVVIKPTAGTNWLTMSPTLPVTLDGRSTRLMGMEFCYQANATAILTGVTVSTTTHVTDISESETRAGDATLRTDEACRSYALAAPYVLTPYDAVNVIINVNFTVAGAQFRIGRTSFVLEPTTNPASVLDTLESPTEGAVVVGAPAISTAEPPKRRP